MQLSAKFRAEQYPTNFHESGEQVFCKFCQHTINWMCTDACNDHLQSDSQAEQARHACKLFKIQPQQKSSVSLSKILWICEWYLIVP